MREQDYHICAMIKYLYFLKILQKNYLAKNPEVLHIGLMLLIMSLLE